MWQERLSAGQEAARGATMIAYTHRFKLHLPLYLELFSPADRMDYVCAVTVALLSLYVFLVTHVIMKITRGNQESRRSRFERFDMILIKGSS